MKKVFVLMALAIITFHAHAQKVLTVKDDAKAVAQAEAGKYHLVKEEWKLEAGTAYMIMMPAMLDGYYFGQDALRMKVISYEKVGTDTYEAVTAEMDDLDDFAPNQVYLVVPKIAVDAINHITPGITTDAVATPAGKELMHTANVSTKTGISDIQLADKDARAAIYDLQGRKVTAVRKGETYIVGGKKVLIK